MSAAEGSACLVWLRDTGNHIKPVGMQYFGLSWTPQLCLLMLLDVTRRSWRMSSFDGVVDRLKLAVFLQQVMVELSHQLNHVGD